MLHSMQRQNRFSCILSLLSSLLLLFMLPLQGCAQEKKIVEKKDTIPFYRGLSVSVDLVGVGMLAFGDYGQIEGAVRVNLKDRFFPTIEGGYGKADYVDDGTEFFYKTGAPFFRVGCDFNLLKKKHGSNRLYAGLRYAFTSYNVDIAHPDFIDPVYGTPVSYVVENQKCNFHWLEIVVGLDTKVCGPLRLGWSVRYKRRLAHAEGGLGSTWYLPGFGKFSKTLIGGTFNVMIDI